MYPHRLVVDANCINAKGQLSAMTALEEYHAAGGLELLITSTLHLELTTGSVQARKAALYQSVGGHLFYFSNERSAQSSVGAPVRPSLLHILHQQIFGRHLTGRALLRAVRDCLHLDQAQMNDADVFVTEDKRLHDAEPVLAAHGVCLEIDTPEQALDRMRTYYRKTIGSDAIERVRTVANAQGPVILGSNSCDECYFSVGEPEDVLFSIRVADGLLQIGGQFRDESGQLLVELSPGRSPTFPVAGASIMQVGVGPILVGKRPMGTAVIASDSITHLAVRMTHTQRAVISSLELRDKSGRVVGKIQGGCLTLQGAIVRFSILDGD